MSPSETEVDRFYVAFTQELGIIIPTDGRLLGRLLGPLEATFKAGFYEGVKWQAARKRA